MKWDGEGIAADTIVVSIHLTENCAKTQEICIDRKMRPEVQPKNILRKVLVASSCAHFITLRQQQRCG